jgi:GT2 family glycosyltransferase
LQRYPSDQFEVIVVDDGSPIPLAAVIEAFPGEMPIRYCRQPNLGPSVARNAGAKLAQGQYLAFTDDDCAPTPDWLTFLAQGLEGAPQAMIGGYTRNALPRNPFSITSQLLIDFLYHYYNQTESRALFFTSNNFAVAADLFWQVGGFDETMPLAAGEDRELCDRWLDHGYKMLYWPRAVILHEHNLRPFSFWRQHFNYGRGAWLYRWLRSQRKEEAVHLEPPDFYLKLISYPLTMARDIRSYILTGMLCFTQAANATGFFYERFFGRHRQKKKLPLREPYR